MFVAFSPAFVVVDGNVVKTTNVNIFDLYAIEDICKKYKLDDGVVIKGPEVVLTKFKKDFNTQFSNRKIEIEITE